MNLRKYLLAFSFSGFVFALDQATKLYIHTQFKFDAGEGVSVIPGFFDIQYVRNQGGAFGLFSQSHEYIRWVLFLLFPIICVFLIFSLLRETTDKIQTVAFGFILGGAVGNYVDRVRLGYVIDFIDWYVKGWHWPTFNIADSFIVIGVSVLVVSYWLERKKPKISS